MIRTKTTNVVQELLVIEAFKSSGYLIVNKTLIQKLGLINAIVLSNLVDKHIYFKEKKEEFDGWFYVTNSAQMKQLNIKEHSLIQCKRYLKEIGMISTKREGLPSKEHYKINFNIIAKSLVSDIHPVLVPTKTGVLVATKTGGHYKVKEKKYKETKKEKINKKKNLAIKLSKIIQSKKKINYTSAQISKWEIPIQKLIDTNGISVERIEAALDWYEKNIGEPFVPVIESGTSLREKFIKLEDAMQRSSFKPKSNQIGHKEPNKIYRTSDKEI
jgi:hypothetical protein